MKHAALIDPGLSEDVYRCLGEYNFDVVKVPLCDRVDSPISGHPDIQFFLAKGICFAQPQTPAYFLKKIEKYFDIRVCSSFLEKKYPNDISYNIAFTGKYAFHKTEFTDQAILKYFDEHNITVIDVPQGYSKCSTLIVDEQSIITSDRKIHEQAQKHGLSSLKIKHGHIKLPGYSYGFIGGISGTTDEHVFLTGNIDRHPDRDRISDFIKSRGKELVFLSNDEAVDGGSILLSPI